MKNNNNYQKLIKGVICLALVVLSTPRRAHAYIDPSVTSFMIQGIAGIVIAVGAGIAIYWRRAKKKVQNKLGIDENANKEKEADVQIYNDADNK